MLSVIRPWYTYLEYHNITKLRTVNKGPEVGYFTLLKISAGREWKMIGEFSIRKKFSSKNSVRAFWTDQSTTTHSIMYIRIDRIDVMIIIISNYLFPTNWIWNEYLSLRNHFFNSSEFLPLLVYFVECGFSSFEEGLPMPPEQVYRFASLLPPASAHAYYARNGGRKEARLTIVPVSLQLGKSKMCQLDVFVIEKHSRRRFWKTIPTKKLDWCHLFYI